MPTYLYACPSCATGFDVIKSMSQLDRDEECPACKRVCASKDRQMPRVNFSGAGDWNTQGFHPALGCYTSSNKHARDIAKRRGLIEVGNEKPEAIHKACEKQRAETREQRWKDADRDKLYD